MKVPRISVDTNKKVNHSEALLEGTVKGAVPYHHTVTSGGTLLLSPNNSYHIIVLLEGTAEFETDGKTYSFSERYAFVSDPQKELIINGKTDVQILEIQWAVDKGDNELLKEYDTEFPLIQQYATAKQYTDRNKSEKTISRVVIEQRNIPRFCMGSVETYGYDSIKAHDHPMLDQYFFSFAENDMDVIINGEKIHMGGNVFLYIPLGSDHGVEVPEGNHLHYLWIDFLIGEEGMKRLDWAHKPTGELRDLSNASK